MTTIDLTPAMHEMLIRAAVHADGSVESKTMTARALENRRLAFLTPLSSGRVNVRANDTGRQLLAEIAEKRETESLIRWEMGRYSSIRGHVGEIEDLFTISSSTNTRKPGYYLDCRLFATSRALHADEAVAKQAAETAFREWIGQLGLQPVPGRYISLGKTP
jgi:hypothetical protein